MSSLSTASRRYEVRPTGKRGRLQIFDTKENHFQQGPGYKPHEFELAERHCAMLNHGEAAGQ